MAWHDITPDRDTATRRIARVGGLARFLLEAGAVDHGEGKSAVWCRQGMTNRSPVTALRAPLFWGALLVLALNDQWLKHAGVLPGWLTGKLSDFAGLVVAPLLMAALFRARKASGQVLCFALVVGPFIAIKVWPSAARGLEQLSRTVGLGWRIWADPTDLLALSVLPLAWIVLRSSCTTDRASRRAWLLERLGGMGAMLACLATSRASHELQTSIVVVNTTHDSVVLQVFRPPAPLDCAAVVADPAATIVAEDFAFEACLTLEALEPVPLDLDWSADDKTGDARVPPAGSKRACDAVLLRAPGLDDTVLFWNDVPKVGIDQFGGVPSDDAHVVYLERVGNRLFAERPDVGQTFPAGFVVPEASCGASSP
jgi:hypothetical protein